MAEALAERYAGVVCDLDGVVRRGAQAVPHAVERLSDTVNYETIAQSARDIAAEGHIGLVESFAERLALACLQDGRVRRVTVRVEKPGALQGAVAPACELTWVR